MATRTFLQYLKQARKGQMQGHLALGKTFLRGGNGLAPNMAGALLWLSKAAQKGSNEAVCLIGEHIPLKIARQHHSSSFMITCYREAGLQGSTLSRWKFVQWIFSLAPPLTSTTSNKQPARPVLPLEMETEEYLKEEQLALAQHSLPPLSEADITDADITLALRWVREMADQGLSAPCWQLAQALIHGLWIKPDIEQAIHYAQLAAKKGEPAAVHWLNQQTWNGEAKKKFARNYNALIT